MADVDQTNGKTEQPVFSSDYVTGEQTSLEKKPKGLIGVEEKREVGTLDEKPSVGTMDEGEIVKEKYGLGKPERRITEAKIIND